ncbi:MAG: hypothetical protein IJN61_01285 [Clostridia bacterium]|nr:hypothetical protein [Clostridia bacterium]
MRSYRAGASEEPTTVNVSPEREIVVQQPKPRRQTTQRKPLTINDVVRWTVQQYKQTGRLISYGNAVAIFEAERNGT